MRTLFLGEFFILCVVFDGFVCSFVRPSVRPFMQSFACLLRSLVLLSIHPFVHPFFYLNRQFVCSLVGTSFCLSFRPSKHLFTPSFVRPSTLSSIHSFNRSSVRIFNHLFFCSVIHFLVRSFVYDSTIHLSIYVFIILQDVYTFFIRYFIHNSTFTNFSYS